MESPVNPGGFIAPQSDIVTVAMRFWWVNQNQTFTQEVSGSTYRSLLPVGQKPPIDMNVEEMARYRDLMRAHYARVDIRFR